MGTDVDDATAERLVQALDLNGSFVVGICGSDGSPRGCFRKERGISHQKSIFWRCCEIR